MQAQDPAPSRVPFGPQELHFAISEPTGLVPSDAVQRHLCKRIEQHLLLFLKRVYKYAATSNIDKTNPRI